MKQDNLGWCKNSLTHSNEVFVFVFVFFERIAKTRAVLGFRGLWVSRFVEHVVFMKGGIRNGLAAVCIWIFVTGWGLSRTMKVDLVQRHDRPVLLKEE